MGEVYRADDLELGQSVALKFLPERLARNPADLARLRAEVRTARQVAHPNVCRTYDIAEAEGQVFLVMEYIDGEDLASVLRRLGRPTPDKALEIARQLCLGLGAAHENGVLHRDLKPANIMIDGRGRVRITDFGLAGTAEEIAAEGSVAGTPAYMAPEQHRTGTASPQSDIFSLGLVLYEVFTGKRAAEMAPAPDPSGHGTDSSVRTPSSFVADIDPAVERVILRCLERDPARRPQSAYAVFGALPGGDPLAAAVAAGETPSPELVANAGIEGSVRPLWAGLAVLAAVAGLLVTSIGARPLLSDLRRSADSWKVRAEELLTEVTGKTPPRFSTQGFRYAPAGKDSSEQADSTRAARLAKGLRPPRAKQYWRRWSPMPLVPANLHRPEALIDEPPQAYPGSATLLFDMQGRLVAMSIDPEAVHDSAGTRGVDWTGVLRAAGRNPASLDGAAPPPGFVAEADTIAAWTVAGPADRDTARAAVPETTLVAAALGGRVVHFDTHAGGTPLGDLVSRPDAAAITAQDWAWLLVLELIPLVGSIVLARHNLRAGRGDRRGALMLFVAVVVLYIGEHVFAMDLAELGPFRVLSALTNAGPLAHALLHATLITLAYLAIEPYIRRLWPGVLVSWARLTSGRGRDPIVGRDVLAGTAWGVGAFLLLIASLYLARTLGLTRDPVQIPAEVLQMTIDPAHILSGTSWALAVAFLNTITFYTVLVLLRFVLRSNRAAAVGVILTFTFVLVPYGRPEAWLAAGFALVSTIVTAFVALRFGFVASAVSLLVLQLAGVFPWTTDLGAWFAPQTLLSWGVIGALLAYGFLTAVGGKSLFRDPLGDPAAGAPRAAK
jgi:serine/threonine-protein kinase